MLKSVFGILATTPDKIRREIAAMSPRELRVRPAPGKWSVQEIVAHLEDIEQVGFRERVEAIVEQDGPLLLPVDQEKRAVELHYYRRDSKQMLASWARQRRANLAWLRKLRPALLKRQGTHQEVGEISVQELVCEWAFHDLGHLRQILEVKRYALYPHIGTMQAFYKLS
ncbi:MAG: DinB family protein [Acidobacteriia bacterium]|nr:DinB family protein [Terriglobia bacterium]